MSKTLITVFADGGCSNNGTPDAKGYASVYILGRKEHTYRIELPKATTNNQAELGALWSALDLLGTLIHTKGDFRVTLNMDSNFALNTVFGDWNIKNKYPILQALRDDCHILIDALSRAGIEIEHHKVPRGIMETMVGH